jgi:carboxylate-amine ligase
MALKSRGQVHRPVPEACIPADRGGSVRLEFHPSQDWTLGVEWELGLVDKVTGDLRPVAGQVLDAVAARGGLGAAHLTGELLTNTVELVTGICRTTAEAADQLGGALDALRTVTDGIGVELFGAGSHPFARWDEQVVSPGDRYGTLIDRTRWWGRQMIIFGVHTHVGVPSRDAVLPLLDAMLCHQPHLQALSAASPFWAGVDTGYASNRALMFQQLPTAGLPFQFETWAEYEAYLSDVLTTGVIDEVSELRWDVRPSPVLGTLETRVCDSVPTLTELAALTALTHCLVVDLGARWLAGERLPRLAPWHVQENKWRAARYGLAAMIICDEGSGGRAGGPIRERLVTEELADLLERLAPTARRLGCEPELAAVDDIVRTGSSSERQRAVAERAGGDLTAVVHSLVEELRTGRASAA